MRTITSAEGRELLFARELTALTAEFIEYVRNVTGSRRDADVRHRARLLEGKAVHIPDVLADPEYDLSEAQRLGGVRTISGCRCCGKENRSASWLLTQERRCEPFTDKQIELVRPSPTRR